MPMLGKGSKLYRVAGSDEDQIMGVDQLTFDPGTADDVDVTDWDSTNGYEEIIQGIKRGGQVTFTTNNSPSISGVPSSNGHYIYIPQLHAAGTSSTWKLQIGSSPEATITFDGLVKNYNLNVPTGDKVVTSVTIKIDGAPTWS